MVRINPIHSMKHTGMGSVARVRQELRGQSRHLDLLEFFQPVHLVSLHAEHLLRSVSPTFKLRYRVLDFLDTRRRDALLLVQNAL